MAFKIQNRSVTVAETPELLVTNLRTKRIPGLLVHQGDVLRDYHARALGEPDVALQLPTGSGKTLVGLAIAEWRRQKFDERSVYLCLTNQLVHQVAAQAKAKYGLEVTEFTGPKTGYSAEARDAYLSAETVAITSYASLFNVNPFFDDPHSLVLDDAHAAEQHIADSWSLRVRRHEDPDLYAALANLLRGVLPVTDYPKLVDAESNWDQAWVDKIPTPRLAPLIPELVSLIDAYVADSPLRFPWGLLRDHVQACHLYVGSREILLRPLIPPTSMHSSFTGAKQRIYMSATLGAGGELERLTGRQKIFRLQVPPGWDRHGIGRRFFLFPASSLGDGERDAHLGAQIQAAQRALILTANEAAATKRRDWARDELGMSVFSARDIEESKLPFTSTPNSVAVIANRYEGIDLIDEECRLLIVDGLARATNLQEQFLISRMGSVALLNDRILTRIVQAVGRCTRTSTDYAAVVVEDERLHEFLLKAERRAFLHPELQAELQFGIDQSRGTSVEGFVENVSMFLEQGAAWAEADAEIVARREQLSQQVLPGTENLRNAAPHEVLYQQAMWRNDFEGALDEARTVLGLLVAPELKGYRALWCYLAGSAAWLAADAGVAPLRAAARDSFREAAKASLGIQWLHSLVRVEESEPLESESAGSDAALRVIERLEQRLERLGTANNRRYDEEERCIRQGLGASDANAFEQAQERLGRLLGFHAGNRNSSAAPDPYWVADEDLCFVFEDYTDAQQDGVLGATKVRQAEGHRAWIRQELPIAPTATIIPIVVSPVSFVDRGAMPHAAGVQFWKLDDFRAWSERALSVVRELRRTFTEPGDLVWRSRALEQYVANHMDPVGLMGLVKKQSVDDLQVRG